MNKRQQQPNTNNQLRLAKVLREQELRKSMRNSTIIGQLIIKEGKSF